MKHNAPLNILPLLAAVAISAYRMVTVTSTGLNHASSGSAVIGVSGIPRSVGIIQPLLMFVALGLSRVAVRLWVGDLYRELLARINSPGVLIYGAGQSGMQLAASLMRMPHQRLVGYLDDSPALQGRHAPRLVHLFCERMDINHRPAHGNTVIQPMQQAKPPTGSNRQEERLERH